MITATATSGSVMVVDDEVGALTTLCAILEEVGYKVTGAGTGNAALEIIKRDSFDAVITDIRLPDMNGLDLLMQAKAKKPDTVVIVITGYASLETAVDAVNRGAYAYFIKPVNPDEIKFSIANALRQKQLTLENRDLITNLKRANKRLIKSNRELHHEIAERKRIEEELRDSEQNFRNSLDDSPSAILITRGRGKVLHANQKMLDLFGYKSVKEMKNTPVERRYPPEHMTLLRERFDKRDRGEFVPEHLENKIIGKDGEIRHVEVFTKKLLWNGEDVYEIIYHDITEKKRVDADLQNTNKRLDKQNEELKLQAKELKKQQRELSRQTNEVAKANRLKSEFLSNMSHELRTPLNVIIGFSELLVDEVPGKINQEQQQCLNDILDSAKQLLNLINEVLDLSKIESGGAEFKGKVVALDEMIRQFSRTIMPILNSRQQSLNIEIEDGLPAVYADEDNISQVLLNLTANASNFTQDGGELKIIVGKENNYCQVSIIDNGVGIRKMDLEKIFEPFVQLDNSPGEGRRGTGLGLSLVKKIVEKHGGQISVKSKYGQGSQFSFTIPVAAATDSYLDISEAQ